MTKWSCGACMFFLSRRDTVSKLHKTAGKSRFLCKICGILRGKWRLRFDDRAVRPNSRSQFKITSKSVRRSPSADKCYIAPAMRRNGHKFGHCTFGRNPVRRVTIKNVRTRKWTPWRFCGEMA